MWNKKLNFPKRVEIYCIYEQGWVSFNVCSYLLMGLMNSKVENLYNKI